MIEYVIISYLFMFIVTLVSTIQEREVTGFKMFLLAPFWFPLILLGAILTLINWSLK